MGAFTTSKALVAWQRCGRIRYKQLIKKTRGFVRTGFVTSPLLVQLQIIFLLPTHKIAGNKTVEGLKVLLRMLHENIDIVKRSRF